MTGHWPDDSSNAHWNCHNYQTTTDSTHGRRGAVGGVLFSCAVFEPGL